MYWFIYKLYLLVDSKVIYIYVIGIFFFVFLFMIWIDNIWCYYYSGNVNINKIFSNIDVIIICI